MLGVMRGATQGSILGDSCNIENADGTYVFRLAVNELCEPFDLGRIGLRPCVGCIA
jgi:hypothetical protein